MLLSKKMKKKKNIFVSVTQKTMMNALCFTTINMEIYINALPAPLSCFKNVHIHTAQNSANKTLNNKTKSLMTLTSFYS